MLSKITSRLQSIFLVQYFMDVKVVHGHPDNPGVILPSEIETLSDLLVCLLNL